MKKFKLLVTGWIPEPILAPYREFFTVTAPTEEQISFSEDEVAGMVGEMDAMFTIAAFPFKKELIEKAGKLRVVANLGVGYDNIDWRTCTEKGIFVVNTPNTVCEPTAEFSIAIMIAITKGIVMYDKELRRTKRCAPAIFFDRDMLLTGKTIGILGYGRIGQAVGRKAQGLGMSVLYFDPIRRSPEEEERLGAEYGSLEEVLGKADVVSCHMPYTPENHHLMDRAAFERMKRTAYFVNAARGPIMDEKALVQALKTRLIRGAATDVFEFEPEVSSELAEIENVVITPHVGSNVLEARKNMVEEALGGVRDVLEGKQPNNVVNRELFQ